MATFQSKALLLTVLLVGGEAVRSVNMMDSSADVKARGSERDSSEWSSAKWTCADFQAQKSGFHWWNKGCKCIRGQTLQLIEGKKGKCEGWGDRKFNVRESDPEVCRCAGERGSLNVPKDDGLFGAGSFSRLHQECSYEEMEELGKRFPGLATEGALYDSQQWDRVKDAATDEPESVIHRRGCNDSYALWINPNFDGDGAFANSHGDCRREIDLSKKYCIVVIRFASSVSEASQHIRDVKQMADATNGKLRHITLRGRGGPTSLTFGEGPDGALDVASSEPTRMPFQLRDAADESLSADGEFELDGAETAQTDDKIQVSWWGDCMAGQSTVLDFFADAEGGLGPNRTVSGSIKKHNHLTYFDSMITAKEQATRALDVFSVQDPEKAVTDEQTHADLTYALLRFVRVFGSKTMALVKEHTSASIIENYILALPITRSKMRVANYHGGGAAPCVIPLMDELMRRLGMSS